jgi:hypothetical protein
MDIRNYCRKIVHGMTYALLKIATAAVIGVIIVLWIRSSQETNRENAFRANVMRDWEQCSTQVKKRLVESDQQGSTDDLLKVVLSECQTQYRAYVERVWEWREEALTDAIKKEISRAKKVRAAGGSEKARKTELIEAAIEQLYGAGVTLDDLKDHFRETILEENGPR